MPDTCKICGRYYAIYSEGHTPNSEECLKNQIFDLKNKNKKLERLLQSAMYNLQHAHLFLDKDEKTGKNY